MWENGFKRKMAKITVEKMLPIQDMWSGMVNILFPTEMTSLPFKG